MAALIRGDETPLFHYTAPQRPRALRAAPPDTTLAEGDAIGAYRVERLLGAGGMGSVYLAHDESLDRHVAIKVIRADQGTRLETLERFRAEARTMARMANPHVVGVHAMGEVRGLPYIVMEYVPGVDLAKLVQANGGPLRVAQALAILDQVCRGASAMHASGLIHGDLKPSNVLFGPAFRAVLTDFGLAHRIGAAAPAWSTPAYGAPELTRRDEDDADLSLRIDVYSIGVIAYELLTGTLPFESEAARMAAMADGARPVRPSVRRPEIGTAFDIPIMEALAWDPACRTASVDLFRRAIAESPPAQAQPEPPLRILVADDDAEYGDVVRRVLAKSFRGSVVETTQDGASALAAAHEYPPDLVVTDLDMPGMNGVELVAALRSDTGLAEVPVIVLSAIGGPADWTLLSRLGANAFLGKPFEASQLSSLARALVA